MSFARLRQRALLLVASSGLFFSVSACDDAVEYEGATVPDAGSDAISDGSDSFELDSEDVEQPPSPEELRAAAAANIDDEVIQYLGEAVVTETVTLSNGRANIYDQESGPACIDGTEFYVSWQDSPTDSNDVTLFMQGGGACWSTKCLASGSAGKPGFPDVIPILSPNPDVNPFASNNKVYLPYCDGSLFGGDVSYDDDEDGELDRIHRGIQNLSAGIDVMKEQYPNPDRILLTGLSAGGFGTLIATNVVRKAYPETEIVVFNDSGVGVLYGDEDLTFFEDRIKEWNMTRLIPDSCTDCLSTGHATTLFEWQLANDPTLRIATFSNFNDTVIAGVFLERDVEAFEDDLIATHQDVHDKFPTRFASFLIDGSGHTAIGAFDTFTVGEDTLMNFLECFRDDLECFDMVIDPSGFDD